ncbi:MAG: hypothetical protein IPN72_24755 [Saprospiraceae bacterium]|nr:hypothetical protein [Saprospiraceae bacterium]
MPILPKRFVRIRHFGILAYVEARQIKRAPSSA